MSRGMFCESDVSTTDISQDPEKMLSVLDRVCRVGLGLSNFCKAKGQEMQVAEGNIWRLVALPVPGGLEFDGLRGLLPTHVIL